MVAGVIGARLAYVLRFPQAFSSNPLDIFSRNLGLLDPFSGTVVGILGAIYAQKTADFAALLILPQVWRFLRWQSACLTWLQAGHLAHPLICLGASSFGEPGGIPVRFTKLFLLH
jgi:prolipoprotein diacylglyceryltransferase